MSNIIDVDTLNNLAEIMGDDMNMLIETYIEDCTGKVAELCEMDLETQQDELFKMAHSLKGSSRNIGVIEFADYCAEAERLARNGELTESDFDVPTINIMFTRAVNELKAKYL
ncbi:MAG: Hpt domain-containing protein [Kangiellaceae bacterium]